MRKLDAFFEKKKNMKLLYNKKQKIKVLTRKNHITMGT